MAALKICNTKSSEAQTQKLLDCISRPRCRLLLRAPAPLLLALLHAFCLFTSAAAAGASAQNRCPSGCCPQAPAASCHSFSAPSRSWGLGAETPRCQTALAGRDCKPQQSTPHQSTPQVKVRAAHSWRQQSWSSASAHKAKPSTCAEGPPSLSVSLTCRQAHTLPSLQLTWQRRAGRSCCWRQRCTPLRQARQIWRAGTTLQSALLPKPCSA